MKIENIVTRIANLFPLKNCILLESIPDLSDNTKAVFDEMIRQKINEQIKIVWIVKKGIIIQFTRMLNMCKIK